MPGRSPAPSRTSGDLPLFGKALGIGFFGIAAVVAVVLLQSSPSRGSNCKLGLFPSAPQLELGVEPPTPLEAEPLTPELRHRGYHECNPHDPMGLGPYAPYRNVCMGRIAIPQQGGHTADYGYDVIVHFHGHSPVRKTLVQVARGVVYVGIDRGLGSGPYANPFKNPQLFPKLRASIEGALRRHSGDERAHIRHLAISAWSAGYGAINEILKRHADRVDAVVLLDGLHAAWSRTRRRRDTSVKAVCDRNIYPTFDFARRALAGEKIFIYTHACVDPERYPSTELTADLLLSQLGLERQPVSGDALGRFQQLSTVDVNGLHVWGFEGTDEHAHCAQISLMARAVRDVLEPAWDTPAMDRNVPPTPAPKLGKRNRAGDDDVEVEPAADDALILESVDEEPVEDAADLGDEVDLGASPKPRAGLERPDATLPPPPAAPPAHARLEESAAPLL